MNHRLDDLVDLSDERFTGAFTTIPKDITALDISNNGLGYRTTRLLVQAFESIPREVISLNISANSLFLKTIQELVALFIAIPSSILHIDLEDNILDSLESAELAGVLKYLPTTIKTINLAGNHLFRNKTSFEKNMFLTMLQPINSYGRLSLCRNGESDFQRAIVPLMSLTRQGELNIDVIEKILAKLLIPSMSVNEATIKVRHTVQKCLEIMYEKADPSFFKNNTPTPLSPPVYGMESCSALILKK